MLRCLAALLAIVWACAGNALAQTNVMFIFDASGSMTTAVPGASDTRIGIAKKAMQKALSEMPADTHLGLMMYGHRRANDCTDLELVSPLGADSAATINKTIQAVKPKGETPIAVALRQAARSFTMLKGQSNSIVLVTDGIEECKGDPCAAANEIKATGLNLKVNIVGFTLSAAQRKLIQCVPDATGGKFFEAKDLPSLNAALGEIRQRTVQASPPPPRPAPPARNNLLLQSNGGQVLAASSDLWTRTNDGKEAEIYWFEPGTEAIFAFKDEKPAAFDTFAVLIPGTNEANLKDFELQVADSPSGPYRSIGAFTTQNLKLIRSPYQEFKFAPVTAKYLKVKLLSAHSGRTGRAIQLYEFQLHGDLVQASAAPAAAAPPSARKNLLLQSNGGQVLAGSNELWGRTIDGKEDDIYWFEPGAEAVFAFKDEKPASFDTFAVLIPGTSEANVKDFELGVADSPSGPFRPIGSFTTQNIKLTRTPYQEFKFDPVTGKYLKVKLLSAHSGRTGRTIMLSEFRLFGTPN